MSDKHGTAIEWTHKPYTKGETWNPIRATNKATGQRGWHCEHVTEACRWCYAERQNVAAARGGTGLQFKPGIKPQLDIFLDEKTLLQPLHWGAPRTIFVCSMSDLHGDWVPDEWLNKIYAVIALCPRHTFIILTKRPERLRFYLWNTTYTRGRILATAWEMLGRLPKYKHMDIMERPFPLPNLWGGTSVCEQSDADAFIPELSVTPLNVRFVSYEPALGPIDFSPYLPKLQWIVSGGESGPHARPSNPQWFRAVRDQCARAGVAFFHKQNGEWVSVSEVEGEGEHFSFPDGRTVRRIGKRNAGRTLDGIEYSAFPQ